MADLFIKQWRRLYFIIKWRVLRQRQRLRLVNGGAMIAIVGGDGAGKTTFVEELYSWLSRLFDIRKIHMGKPPWSLTTFVARGLLKIGNLLGLFPFTRASIEYPFDANTVVFPGYPWAIRKVCTARDRNLLYVKSRRFASNGSLVICDRFPLPQVKLMDAPQVKRMTGNYPVNWFIKYLINLEKKFYESIQLPEVLIVLRVDPEIAVQRKADEDMVSVRARSTEIMELDWKHIPAYVIDASRTRTEILSELKALIWSEL
jgi:thymidylate kinase